jgi:hypothetical protein
MEIDIHRFNHPQRNNIYRAQVATAEEDDSSDDDAVGLPEVPDAVTDVTDPLAEPF